jgi:signal transduction histidine kinase
MSPKPILKPLILCFLMIVCLNTRAQKGDSLKRHLEGLLVRFQQHHIPDTVYLKGVDSIAPRLVKDDSLKQELSAYRQIAFDNKALGAYRGKYYSYLALYSYNRNEFGSAIYYAERDIEEKTKSGVFEKGGIPRADMFAITVYYNNRDYARVFAKYNTLRPALLKTPAGISAGKVSPDQAYLAFGILNSVAWSSYNKKDTSRTAECIRLCEQMLAAIAGQPDKYKADTVVYQYIYHIICYAREKYLHHYERANDFLQIAFREVRSKSFRPNWQPAYTEEIYGEAVEFFFDNNKEDSAARYLNLIRTSNDSLVSFSSMNQRFFLDNDSKLLAGKGNYEAAYKDLRKVYQMSDSSFYAVSADKDNNLYALAEAENTRNELLATEAKKEKAERFSTILFALLGLLVFAGVIGFLLYRAKQKQHLLNLQLSLARNFHDEIGPMLLYANTLVKKESEEHASPRLEELKGQIAHIMESVRSISHDLKSNELNTVDTFYKEIKTLSEKIMSSTRIEFEISVNNGQRILSHLQFTNLRKMLNELVTNSIKHAGCSLISIDLKALEKNILIRYSDNGQGMAAGFADGGIGMQNVKERAAMLNGEFQLYNAWPNGYYIDISIPLF